MYVERWSDLPIERCHRMGTRPKDPRQPPRPIIVKFSFFKDRQYIWNNKSIMAGSKIYVKEDFPPEIDQRVNIMLPIFHVAKKDNRTLEAFNFGETFRSFIRTIYRNISSAVINNGEISEWFNPQCGVRQGCPISPYLFIMAIELLAISIRENPKIQGIKIGNLKIKLTQLADDMTCFITNIKSIIEIMNTFNKFIMCSGLKVNVEKNKSKI